MIISEKAAYIKGLIEGLELDKSSKEGKIICEMMLLVEAMCDHIDELREEIMIVGGQLDEIDEDLGSLETDFYELADCECDDEEHSCGCGCGCHGEEDFDDEEEAYFEVTCPNCNDTIELNEAMLDEGSVDCPGCGVKLEFDFDEILDEEEIEE